MMYRDTKSDIAGGAVAAQELLDAGAKVIIVTGDFDFGGGAARAANARETLAIAPFAADPKFGVRGIGPYAFSFSTASDTVGAALAEFATKRDGRPLTSSTRPTSNMTNPSAPHSMRASRSSTAPTASSAPTCS